MNTPDFIHLDLVKQYINAIRYKGIGEIERFIGRSDAKLDLCSTPFLTWAFYFLKKLNPSQENMATMMEHDRSRFAHPVGVDTTRTISESIDYSSKQALYDNAISIIKQAWPALTHLIEIVQPRVCFPNSQILAERSFESASDPKYFGNLYFAMTRETPMGWAEIIAHEMAHHYLFVVYSAFHRKVKAPWKEVFHSSIRNTQRPLIGILHATIAETFMIILADTVLSNDALKTYHDEAQALKDRQLEHLRLDFQTVQTTGALDIDDNLKDAVIYCLELEA